MEEKGAESAPQTGMYVNHEYYSSLKTAHRTQQDNEEGVVVAV